MVRLRKPWLAPTSNMMSAAPLLERLSASDARIALGMLSGRYIMDDGVEYAVRMRSEWCGFVYHIGETAVNI